MVVKRLEKLESKHGGIHHTREFLSKMKLVRVDNGILIMTVEPKEGEEEVQRRSSRKRSSLKSTTKATESTTVRFTKVGERDTKVELVTTLSLGGNVSKGATTVVLKKHLSQANEANFCFNNLQSSSEMVAEDGKIAEFSPKDDKQRNE